MGRGFIMFVKQQRQCVSFYWQRRFTHRPGGRKALAFRQHSSAEV